MSVINDVINSRQIFKKTFSESYLYAKFELSTTSSLELDREANLPPLLKTGSQSTPPKIGKRDSVKKADKFACIALGLGTERAATIFEWLNVVRGRSLTRKPIG